MGSKLSGSDGGSRVERELERERHERMLHDEARAGLAADDDLRTKDARESMNSTNLKRSLGR
jgi:hypothetical protein